MTEDKSIPVPNLSPSSDYALNAFLLDIANEITGEELEDLKFLVSGDYGITKRALEKIKRPIHLFTALRERGLLNSNNLLTLQSMLWHIKKRNLLQRYVEFAENIGVPYFVVPNDTPENGYTHVNFHIKGKSLCQLKRSELEELRMKISEIMHVPSKFIIIAGIQASNSLVITFMVPREFTYLLKHCKSEHTPIFQLLSVDKWIVDDITVIVEECLEYVFRNLAHDITKSNMKALLRDTTLTGKELEESKHSAYALLQNTFRQKKTQLGEGLEIKQFLRDFFKPIQRSDLEQKAWYYAERYHEEEFLKQSQSRERSAKPQTQPGTPKRQRYNSESTVGKREESLSNSQEERLSKIEGMLERIEKSFTELHSKADHNPLEKYQSMLESSGVKSKYKGLLMHDLFPLNM